MFPYLICDKYPSSSKASIVTIESSFGAYSVLVLKIFPVNTGSPSTSTRMIEYKLISAFLAGSRLTFRERSLNCPGSD